MSVAAGPARAGRIRPWLIGALSVLVVGLVVAGLVAPNVVSMPLTVRVGAPDPGPGPNRAAPVVTGPIDTPATTPIFGTVGLDDDLTVGAIRFSLTPANDPAGAVEWMLDGPGHYRIEAPVTAGEYELTVTATVEGEDHTEHATATLTDGQALEVSTLISSAPWLVFFLPVPAY